MTMPLEIDEIQSEVSVEGRANAPAQVARRALPGERELERWRQLARSRAWEEARTCAVDRDD